LYKGRYDKPTPPGYSGIAFAPPQEETAEKSLKNSPTPVGNGAGEDKVQQDTNSAGRLLEEILQSRSRVSKASEDRRNEIKILPRNFSGTGREEGDAVESAAKPGHPSKHDENGEGYALLSSLFQRKVSLEDLLLLGTALLLATKEEKGEAFPMFALL